MKQSVKILLGLVLIAAGVLWILNITGVFSFVFSTKGWWTLFIIVPSILSLINGNDKWGPCIGIGWGVLLLLASRSVISWNLMWQIGLAMMIILLGLQLILRKGSSNSEVSQLKTISRDGKEIRRIESSFGKQNLSFSGEKFEGADVECSFGSVTLDLNGALMEADSIIDLNVGFSGVVIVVPQNMPVKIIVNSGFGGVNDNRRVKVLDSAGAPTLYITGKVGFGGVEIRN